MGRASVASLLALAGVALIPALLPGVASALPAGYGKGPGYCTQYGNQASLYSFDDVYACASTASPGPTTFDADEQYSFQCVELSARFLWAVYGIWAGPGSGVDDGADLVSVVHGGQPGIRVWSPGPRSVPAPGDVISLGPGDGADPRYGHTAVVVAANRHTGWFRIMSENLPAGGAGEQSLRVDLRGRHNGRAELHGMWTRASWLALHPWPPLRRRHVHRRPRA